MSWNSYTHLGNSGDNEIDNAITWLNPVGVEVQTILRNEQLDYFSESEAQKHTYQHDS